jgi:GNAT superfamily N-acetyltransferase
MIFHPVFQRSILGISQIVEEGTQKGLILSLRPFGEFRAFGFFETALLVFPEFRRQGIGKSVLSLLNADRVTTFFVSATSNKASSAFFGRQSELVLAHENDRYRVYQNF